MEPLTKTHQKSDGKDKKELRIKISSTDEAKEKTGQRTKEDILRSLFNVGSEKIARGYCRVSTAKQTEGWSLDVQDKRIREYCLSKNLKLVDVYTDEGLSAKDYKSRPAFCRMLNEISPFDTVVTVSFTRLARNAYQFTDVHGMLKSKNVILIMLDLNIDDSTAAGNAMLQVLATFSELERNMISERTVSVMRSMARDGTLRTKPPFGWKIENKEMVEDSYEQTVIELIRTMKDEDPKITLTEICNFLTKKNVKIRKSKKIYPETIKRIMIKNNII